MPYTPERRERIKLSGQELADNLDRLTAFTDDVIEQHYQLINDVFLHDAVMTHVSYTIGLLKRAKISLKRGIDAAGELD